MEHKTLLSVLSPQLQALVEAQLGEKLPVNKPSGAAPKAPAAPSSADVHEQAQAQAQSGNGATQLAMPTSSTASRIAPAAAPPVKLNPPELFVLRHPDSPGYVVKHNFLGRDDAMEVHNALTAFAHSVAFHQAAVGHGDNKREQTDVRGDRIHWLQRPADLRTSMAYDPSILLLLRKVESVVFGIKNAMPELDLRNVTSTQLAIFPGDGARFVKHTDTYSTAHNTGRSDHGDRTSGDQLVRLLTCVYYLNPQWVSSHGGCLRVFTTKDSSSSFFDIAPALDTLVVFRSTDVEHEVLPTFHDRMALTIWYYGPAPSASKPSTPSALNMAALASSFLTPLSPTKKPETHGGEDEDETNETIFVAIPSYRDSECRHTVDDLLLHATYRKRISIGICLQTGDDDGGDDGDDTQRYLEAKYPREQVRIHRIHYRDAAGPCVARAMAQQLYGKETFYLQIDSHMRVRDGWDTFFIDELKRCPTPEKAILTTYPLGYTQPNQLSEDTRPTVLCASHFDDHGILRQCSKTLTSKPKEPIPSLFWAAGFAFSFASVITQVPYDGSLQFLFFGEESSMSARLWMGGWNFYAPSEMKIYHLWTRAYRPVFQELENEQTKKQKLLSLEKVKKQLRQHADDDDEDDNGKTQRSLEEYQRFLGVDFELQTIEWRAQWGNLDPIQFDLSVTK